MYSFVLYTESTYRVPRTQVGLRQLPSSLGKPDLVTAVVQEPDISARTAGTTSSRGKYNLGFSYPRVQPARQVTSRDISSHGASNHLRVSRLRDHRQTETNAVRYRARSASK